jgi:type III pantothenate kinase
LNLVIDQGNSRTKVAVFSSQEIVEIFIFDELTIGDLEEVANRYKGLDHAILSSVSATDPSLNHYLDIKFSCFIELNNHTPVPLTNGYTTPDTLGLDRLAAAVGANYLFPDEDLMVIDAGTAITFDLVGKTGTFLGGNISPGLKSRFRALHEFTHKLPLVMESDQWPFIGKTTEEAIRAGVINGMLLETDGMIDQLKKDFPALRCVLTGGDAPFFERRLKNHIFVKSEITLIGLNRILEYNVEKL